MKLIRCLLLTFIGFSNSVLASWTLDNSQSSLHFTFIKNTHLATTGEFLQFDGNITDNGLAKLTIDLNSLETGIIKRDSRLRDLFFRVVEYPQAEVNLKLSQRIRNKIQVGKSTDITITAKTSLNGKTVSSRQEMSVFAFENGDVEVSTGKPILLNSQAFGYSDRLEQLVKIAGVNNISKTVIVNFRLYYSQDEKIADASE